MKRWMIAWLWCELFAGAADAGLQYFDRFHDGEKIDPDYTIPIWGTAPDSSAGRAGLREGDRILEVYGLRVRCAFEMALLRNPALDGDQTTIKVDREGLSSASCTNLGMTVRSNAVEITSLVYTAPEFRIRLSPFEFDRAFK